MKFETKELKVIEQSRAVQIKKTFEPMAEMLAGFEADYLELIGDAKKGITQETCNKAKRLRLNIGRVRIDTGKLKDKQKEYIKLEDKAIMGVHNILVWAVKEKEDNLKEIENHFEIKERKRLEILQASRVELLTKYVEDAHERDLSGMDIDVWDAYFLTKKQAYEDIIVAEKKAEIERVAKEKAEKEEQERIRKENERLRKEVESKEEERLAELEKIRKVQEEKDSKEKERLAKIAEIERQKREKEQKERQILLDIEAKKQQKEQNILRAKAEKERKEKERLEKELIEKEQKEIKRLKDIETAKQAELNKGDAEKVKDLINDLENLAVKYSFKSEKNNKMYADVKILIEKVVNHIKTSK